MKESGCVYSGSFLFQRTLRRKEINEMTEYNMLKDFNFQDIETKRIRTVGYKSDHNTPCRHFYNAWPLEKVLGEDRYSGLYLVLIDAAVQNGGTDYNGGYYIVFNEIGDNVHTALLSINGHDSMERLKEHTDEGLRFKSKDGFLNALKDRVSHGYFIRETDIMALEMIGEAELAKQYRIKKTEWLAERERQEIERREKLMAEEAEKERRLAEENAARLNAAETSIKARQRTPNTDGVILDLMRHYGIDVPLRTQGWILNSLAEVNFDGQNGMSYRYWKRGKATGSQAFFNYMWKLVNVIDGATA